MRAVTIILGLLVLCGGLATSQQQVRYMPVPGLLFSMNVVDAPSARYGFDEWEAALSARCRELGGNYTAEARRFNMNGQPIRTVVVYCWEIKT